MSIKDPHLKVLNDVYHIGDPQKTYNNILDKISKTLSSVEKAVFIKVFKFFDPEETYRRVVTLINSIYNADEHNHQ